MNEAQAIELLKDIGNVKPEKTNGIFPIDVLPDGLQGIIKHNKEILKHPIDFTGASILYAISVAIGNTYHVKAPNGYKESLPLYMVLVGQPGTAKSHPLTWCLKPIFERDSQLYDDYKNNIAAYREALANDENPGEKPTLKKHLISDATPEAVASIHEKNPRGIGLYIDELKSWFGNFDRYRAGSEAEFWLSNWSGKPIIVDRKSQEPIRVDNPFISIAGTIQPGVLESMAKNRDGNGFLDRFLFCWPRDLRKEPWSDKLYDYRVADDWHTFINRLLDISWQGIDEVEFTTEAWERFLKWQHKSTEKINAMENEAMQGVATKLELYALRFSLLLYVADCAASGDAVTNVDKIDVQAVEGAIRLVDYFQYMAGKVHGQLDASPVDKLPENKRRLYDALPSDEPFKTKDAVIMGSELMSARTVKTLLNDNSLFQKIKYGIYARLY